MQRMLDQRAQLLLKTLIERYIAEGQPVGSRTLSRHSGLDLSPATIRNVMSDLEELGLIASPHTSAGRVPTPAGYRFFIDSLLVVKPLESRELHQLEDQLHADNPQRAIQSASQLLSQLPRFAGVVMPPRRRALAFRQVEFLRLSEKRVLLIIVTQDGDVQNRVLFTERDYSPAELVSAANYLNQNYGGQSFELTVPAMAASGKAWSRTSTAIPDLTRSSSSSGTLPRTETRDGSVTTNAACSALAVSPSVARTSTTMPWDAHGSRSARNTPGESGRAAWRKMKLRSAWR